MTYLNETSPDAFFEYPPLSERVDTFKRLRPSDVERMHLCPRCKGHGGWNLKLGAYGLPPGMENTEANRHKYCNFRASCAQCNGWGYVTKQGDIDCVHVDDHGVRVGNCLTKYTCTKCKRSITVDSSG